MNTIIYAVNYPFSYLKSGSRRWFPAVVLAFAMAFIQDGNATGFERSAVLKRGLEAHGGLSVWQRYGTMSYDIRNLMLGPNAPLNDHHIVTSRGVTTISDPRATHWDLTVKKGGSRPTSRPWGYRLVFTRSAICISGRSRSFWPTATAGPGTTDQRPSRADPTMSCASPKNPVIPRMTSMSLISILKVAAWPWSSSA